MTEFNAVEIAPCIYEYKNAFENSEEIVKKAVTEREDQWDFAKMYDQNGSQFLGITERNTQSINLDPYYSNDVFWWLVSQKIWQYGDHYAKKNSISFAHMEDPQLLYYGTGEGHYGAHVDSSKAAPRIFSCLVYLNDVEEGGETYFPNFNISVKPEKGKVVLFPANYAYVHEARVPISNQKFVLVTWFRE